MKSLLLTIAILIGGLCHASSLPIINVPIIGVGEVHDPSVFFPDGPPTYMNCTKEVISLECVVPNVYLSSLCPSLHCPAGQNLNQICVEGQFEYFKSLSCFQAAKRKFYADCAGINLKLLQDNADLWDIYKDCADGCLSGGGPPAVGCLNACCAAYHDAIHAKVISAEIDKAALAAVFQAAVQACVVSDNLCGNITTNCCW